MPDFGPPPPKKPFTLKHHGLTWEAYVKMWEEQKGLCAICLDRPAQYIDHDHRTGRLRGLLCPYCNSGLGLFNDSKESLERAIKYVS